MADAVLGIAVESAEAEREMRNFEAVAKRTGESVEQVAARFKKMRDEAKNLPNPLKGASDEAARMGSRLEQMAGGSKAAEAAIKLLSGALGRIVNSMATGGIAGVTAAITTYALDSLIAFRDLDEKLKAHAEIVRSLKEAYGEAGKGVDTAVRDSATVLKTLLSLSTDQLQRQFKTLAESVVASMSSFETLGDAVGMVIETTAPKFSAFKKPIDDLREGLRDGTVNIRGFREAVSRIADSSADENVRKLAKQLIDATEGLNKIEMAANSAGKALRGFSADALAAAEQGEAFAKAMKSLAGTVTPDLSTREKIMKNYSAAVESAGSTEERVAAARLRDDQLSILSANEHKKALMDAAREAESAAKRYQTLVGTVEKHIAVTNAATVAVGRGIGSLAALRQMAAQPSNDNKEAQSWQPAKAA